MTDTFARMRQLNGTTAEWAANDLVIGLGEFAVEKIAGGAMRLKLGDGVAKFSQLPYFDPGVFSYVLKGGDTMTGPLIVPGLTVNAGGLTVSGGNSNITAPINLGPSATTGEPTPADNNNSKVPTTHWVQTQVAGIITGLNYLGTWDAATNTPPLASGGLGVPTPVRGDFYMVSVAGSTDLDGNTTWLPGDFVAFNGVAWQRIPQPLTYDQIVAGLGYVPADDADVAALQSSQIPKTLVDAAGDLIVGTAADTVARLAKGTAGQVLEADAAGLVWRAPSSRSPVLYSEVVTTAGPTEMRVTIPTPYPKKIEIEFSMATADATPQGVAFQALQSAAIVAGTNYAWQYLLGTGTTPQANGAINTSNWTLGTAIFWKGILRPCLVLPSGHSFEGQGYAQGAGGIRIAINWAGDLAATVTNITGFRLGFGPGTPLAVGSFMRCYVVT